MEFTIQQDDLLKGLQKSQSVAEKRSSMPILSNVLLEAGEGELRLTATDLEVSFTGTYTAGVVDSGAITVQARKFYEIVKELPAQEIRVLGKENQWLHVSSGSTEYNLVGLPADEFPKVMKFDAAEWVELETGLLKDMIEKTIYAVSTEETRYNLSGIYFEKTQTQESPGLRLVATDGHRLSLVERDLAEVEKFPFTKGVIIPRKGLHELVRLLEDGDRVQVSFSDNVAVFRIANSILMMRLVDGEFPDYNTVIPKKFMRVLDVDRVKFMETLRRMAIISTERYRGVRCNIFSERIEIISNNPEIGDAREELPIRYKGEEMTIAFNPRYFLDALSVMTSPIVQAKMLDESSACAVSGAEDEGFMAVVMPMRL
jgi:DNA polymerase-3 subunit beta